jgi:Flp pilus assembly pilin Flp
MHGDASERQSDDMRPIIGRASRVRRNSTRNSIRSARGQSLVEYGLIIVLVVTAIAAAIVLTGPAIGNVFSNTVYNVLGQTTTPYSTLSSNQIVNEYATAMAHTLVPYDYVTNTPPAPTCDGHGGTPGKWATAVGQPATYVPC